MKKIIVCLFIGLTIIACSPKDHMLKVFPQKEKQIINDKDTKQTSQKVTITKTPLKKTENPFPLSTPQTQEEEEIFSEEDLTLDALTSDPQKDGRKIPSYNADEQYKYNRPKDLKLDENYLDPYVQNRIDKFGEEKGAYSED